MMAPLQTKSVDLTITYIGPERSGVWNPLSRMVQKCCAEIFQHYLVCDLLHAFVRISSRMLCITPDIGFA